MRFKLAILSTLIGMTIAFAHPASAQSVPPGAQQPGGAGLSGSISHADLERLSGDRTTPEKSVLEREKDIAQSKELASALQLACQVRNAEAVGTRQVTTNGKVIESNVYEVACANHTGYFLMSQGAEKPVGISCLAAEGTRAADVARGKAPDLVCQLPENKNIRTMATLLMGDAGTYCDVSSYQWFGKSAATHTEFSEVVCNDGKGYLLRTPEAGASAPNTVITCQDAARQGLKCRLTDAGPVTKPTLTLQSLKEALAQSGVSCPIERLRVVGQEDARKRYVVEYRCADAANPMIAFVPLAGNENPYESMDCAAAVARRVICEYATAN